MDDVKLWIKNGRLCGNVVISYLKRKGYPEVALHFVDDLPTRFNLSLEYGHLSEALKSAQQMQEEKAWTRLGTQASHQGSVDIVEMSLQKTKNLDGLSFHYLVTGNCGGKLERMLKIAEKRGDTLRQFNNSLLLGDAEERVRTLCTAGQHPLALLTARTNGLDWLVDELKLVETLGEQRVQAIEEYGKSKSGGKGKQAGKLLIPAVSVLRNLSDNVSMNWPLLEETERWFSEKQDLSAVPEHVMPQVYAEKEDPRKKKGGGFNSPGGGQLPQEIGAEWDDEGDLDLPTAEATELTTKHSTSTGGQAAAMHMQTNLPSFQGPKLGLGQPAIDAPSGRSPSGKVLFVDLVVAGRFSEALGLLKRRIGLKDASSNGSLQRLMWEVYSGAHAYLQGIPEAPVMPVVVPAPAFTAEILCELKNEGSRRVQAGQFEAGLNVYRRLIVGILFCAAESAAEEQQLKTELLPLAVRYVTVLSMQLAKKKAEADPTTAARAVELVSLMPSVPGLESTHRFLFLRQAMTATFRSENFLDAANFSTQILNSCNTHQTSSSALVQKTVQQAQAILQAAEARGTNKLGFALPSAASTTTAVKICAAGLVWLQDHEPIESCSYCGATYAAKYTGGLCSVCQMGEIGKRVLGLDINGGAFEHVTS